MTKEKKGTGLRYVRVYDALLVPKYLLEQVEDLGYPPERFYQLGGIIFGTALQFLGVFVDAENQVKGVLWFALDPLHNALFVQLVSVDPEYRGKGFLSEVSGICRKHGRKYGVGKYFGLSSTPEIYESLGMCPSKRIFMEAE